MDKRLEEVMIYAISDMRGKWIILKGWHGCQAGQGNILQSNVDEKNVQKAIRRKYGLYQNQSI